MLFLLKEILGNNRKAAKKVESEFFCRLKRNYFGIKLRILCLEGSISMVKLLLQFLDYLH